jgi:lipoate-protein ligase A
MKFIPYRLEGTDPLDHLAIEEVMVGAWKGPDAALLFYINTSCVVIGRNQNPWREINAACRFPVFRRASGGGTVYHDLGNLNWAIIAPRQLHSQEIELAKIAAAISSLGVDVVAGQRGGIFGAPRTRLEAKKISGTARRFGSRNVLHHGTLLVNADLDALRGSLDGIETFEDASIVSVPAHPSNLSEALPGLNPGTAIDGISSAMCGIDCQPFPDNLAFADTIARARTKFTSEEWIYGNTPKFSVYVSSGEKRAAIVVAGGIISAVEIHSTISNGDFSEFSIDLEKYIGVRFSFETYSRLRNSLLL